MPRTRKARLRQRITLVGARLTLNQSRLAALDDADSLALPKPIKALVEKLIAEGKLPKPSDNDGDGVIDFDDWLDALIEYLDEHIEPNNPIFEWISDVGIGLAAQVALIIYKNTKPRLEKRIAADKALLAALKRQIKALAT